MARHVITDRGEVVTEVTVGRGVATAAALVAPDGEERQRVAILAQPSTGEIAGRLAASLATAGVASAVEVLPDGEAAKSLGVVEQAYRSLNHMRLARHDLVVGVGGGALTDVAGFVAATYLRGVDVVLVPTTLLGAVDAAIGGKTAVNVDGKNLAGAFHHPVRVLVDLDVLERAPRRAAPPGGRRGGEGRAGRRPGAVRPLRAGRAGGRPR